MPAAIPFIVSAVTTIGAAIGGAAGAFLIMESALIATTFAYGTLAALTYNQIQSKKRKARDAYNASLKDRQVMTATTDASRKRVYGGPVRVSGEVVYKATSGAQNEFYTLVVLFASHQIEAIDQVYAGDQPLVLDGKAVVTEPFGGRQELRSVSDKYTGTGAPFTVNFTGPVQNVVISYKYSDGYRTLKYRVTPTSLTSTSVTFDSIAGRVYSIDYQYNTQPSFMHITPFLGGDSQDIHSLVRDHSYLTVSQSPSGTGTVNNPYATAINTEILATDKFRGCAGVIVFCTYDPTAYPGGVPPITGVVRGCNTVFDPRTGTTGWTDNPALCARDWALYKNGGGCAADELDDASFIVAANACDTSNTYVDSAGTSTTTKLFKLAYVAALDESPETHVEEMMMACAGSHVWSGGQLRVKAGVYRAPLSVTIDESWLAGGVSIDRGTDVDEMVNIYRPTIVDASQNYTAVPLPALRIQAYIDEDGRELPSEIALTGINFAPQAMHVCGIMARDARWGRKYRLVCNLKAYPLQAFDVVRLNLPRYNANSKAVEVIEWSFVAPAQVVLVLKETDANIYNPDAVFTVDIPSTPGALSKPWLLPPFSINEPDSGELHLLVQSDGSIKTRVLITYAPIASQAVTSEGSVEVAYSVVGSGEWITETFPGDSPSVYLTSLADGETYLIKARLRAKLAIGAWSAHKVHTVIGKTAPPPAPDKFTVRVMPDGTRLLEGGYTTTVRPVDFLGWRAKYRQGSGPYTWGELLPFQTDNDGIVTALPIETNLLNAGDWTLGLVGVDTSGNESAPIIITSSLPNPRLGDALLFLSLESLDFPGTLTDCVRDTLSGEPILLARDQSTWATISSWNAWTRWNHYPVSTWTYQTNAEDFGVVVSTLPVVDVSGVGSFVTQEQHSTDGSTWTAWAAIASSFSARYVRIRVVVTASGPTGAGVTQITYIQSMKVVYTAAVSTEVLEDINPSALTGSYRIGTGDIRLPITGTYANLRVESLVIQSSASGSWTWQVVDKNTSPGPRVKFFNAGVLADPPLIDVTLKGIKL